MVGSNLFEFSNGMRFYFIKQSVTCTEKLQQCYHCISQEAAIDILRAEFGERLRHSVATVSLLPTIPRVRARA